MKRIGCMLILAALASVGCFPSTTFFQDDKKPPKVVLKEPPPVVTADAVSEKNAADKAKALREELEHELRGGEATEKDS